MKIIVDVPHEIICKRYLGENDKIWMVHAVKNGQPLIDVLNYIKADIEQMPIVLLNGSEHIDRTDTLEIINNRIENNC